MWFKSEKKNQNSIVKWQRNKSKMSKPKHNTAQSRQKSFWAKDATKQTRSDAIKESSCKRVMLVLFVLPQSFIPSVVCTFLFLHLLRRCNNRRGDACFFMLSYFSSFFSVALYIRRSLMLVEAAANSNRQTKKNRFVICAVWKITSAVWACALSQLCNRAHKIWFNTIFKRIKLGIHWNVVVHFFFYFFFLFWFPRRNIFHTSAPVNLVDWDGFFFSVFISGNVNQSRFFSSWVTIIMLSRPLLPKWKRFFIWKLFFYAHSPYDFVHLERRQKSKRQHQRNKRKKCFRRYNAENALIRKYVFGPFFSKKKRILSFWIMWIKWWD